MVHALQLALRALRPGGILIDLRPAPVQRHVGILRRGRFRRVGRLRESLADDLAADRAITAARAAGMFRLTGSARFQCRLIFSSTQELCEWASEPGPGKRVLRELERRRAEMGKGTRIAILTPVIGRAYEKLDAATE